MTAIASIDLVTVERWAYSSGMAGGHLGEYLRARHGQVAPEQVGLPSTGNRRVSGLRREEIATTAGVSVDYYTRLEQGRERHPSVQVLSSLATVLQLDHGARLHLFRLAGLSPTTDMGSRSEAAAPELRALMDLWSETPAFVLGHAYDILACNALALELFVGFREHPNLLEHLFLDPGARTFYADWERVAAYTVAGFRIQYGASPGDERIAEVLRVMSERSSDFAEMWARHEARGARLEQKTFRHPEVGELTLRINAFDVKAAPGQELVVYHADAGSPSAEALAAVRRRAASVGH
ncbi:helix-turn-helix domain-containing protein [Paramicrobacterium sp. CJ85]|uniref:helix-turn-helix domain-containing protein n=1 Tax=Paramicrobacterium sp. CJ85 TaxID=3445355 RepID=UPI003F6080D2